MKLRDNIRSPQRLEQDPSYAPKPKKPSQKHVEIQKPQFIDYDPNLPPAAFPTLDRFCVREYQARDAGWNGHSGGDITDKALQGDAPEVMSDSGLLTDSEAQRDASLSPTEDIPTEELDNAMASNGYLNIIWMSNVARVAAAAAAAVADDEYGNEYSDMTDTDYDAPPPGQPDTPPTRYRDPAWSDLSNRMQAEIFSNLLEEYSYPTVCRLLGLTNFELDAVEASLESRREQMEMEDIQLEAMRAKQLRELLKIDNSPRIQSQSHQLAFRKASRQTFRNLREAVSPKLDFFSCEEHEHRAAKSFLRKREIEAKHAGSWGIGFAQVRDSRNEVSWSNFGLDGGPSPNLFADINIEPTSHEAAPLTTLSFSYSSISELNPPTEIKKAFLNHLGDALTVSGLEHHQCYDRATKQPSWLTLLNEKPTAPGKSATVKRKQDQCDLTRCQDRYSSPPKDLTNEIPLDLHPADELARNYRQEVQQKHRGLQLQRLQQKSGIIRRPISNSGSPTASVSPTRDKKLIRLKYRARRSASGSYLALSTKSSQHSLSTFEPSYRPSSTNLKPQQRHQGHARRVAATDAMTQTETGTDTNVITTDITLTGLVKTHRFISLSPSTLSGHRLSISPDRETITGSETDTELVQASGLPSPTSPITVSSDAQDGSRIGVESEKEDEGKSEEEDEGMQDEDEMVLVPMSAVR